MDLTTLSTRDLGTLLRLADARAVRHVRGALRRAKGSVRDAAKALGLPREETLHEWLRLPSLARAQRQGKGSVGDRARAAAETRRKDAGS